MWYPTAAGRRLTSAGRGNRIERNRLDDNGDGIIVGDVQDTLISRNLLTGTGSFGFPDTAGFGIVLDGADRTTVDRNILTGGRGPAIFVTRLEAPTVSEDNVVSRNVSPATRRWDPGRQRRDRDPAGPQSSPAATATTASTSTTLPRP